MTQLKETGKDLKIEMFTVNEREEKYVEVRHRMTNIQSEKR